MHNTYVLHYCFTFIIPATDVTSLQPAFRGRRRFPSPSLNRAFPKPSRLFPRERPVSAPPTPTPTPKNRFKSDRRAPESLQSTQEAETVSIPKKNLWNRQKRSRRGFEPRTSKVAQGKKPMRPKTCCLAEWP